MIKSGAKILAMGRKVSGKEDKLINLTSVKFSVSPVPPKGVIVSTSTFRAFAKALAVCPLGA